MKTVVDEIEEKEVQEEKTEVRPATNAVEYLREVRTEFFKISWPSREQIAREFFSVILLVAVITGIIFVLDKIFEFLVSLVTGKLFY